MEATLLLADGSKFQGTGIGAPGLVTGEFVFTTAMTGYQEALTDPSYRGQMLMFTYPLIGNYGVSAGRAQSDQIHARAIVVANLTETWDGVDSLGSYLAAQAIPGIYGVDTRAIAQRVRESGAMPAALSVYSPGGEAPPDEKLRTALAADAYDRSDFVAETTSIQPITEGSGSKRVVLLDCGNKRSIIAELCRRDATVVSLPAFTSVQEILAMNPDGVLVSNGPGNPATPVPIIKTVQELYGRLPLFGLCLGHQVLALAAGAETFKLKFGHRGANHPVVDCLTGKAFVTTQNHGYAVDPDSVPDDWVVSHRNLNDGTVEGLRHKTLPVRSVQFHPEGAPGPKDTGTVLDEWLETIS